MMATGDHPSRISSSDQWVVGLDAWMVMYGALRDVQKGDQIPFGLRVIPLVVGALDEVALEPIAQSLAMNYYRFRGMMECDPDGVQYLSLGAIRPVLGCGVLPDKWHGKTIDGEFELVLDVEAPAQLRMQPIWCVENIIRQTSNWRERRTEENRLIAPGRELPLFSALVRDGGLQFEGKPVERTHAFSDDGGLAHYNLIVRMRV
jgi:hypothetical protein